MARLTVQLGGFLIVPIATPRRFASDWRLQSLVEAGLAATTQPTGWRRCPAGRAECDARRGVAPKPRVRSGPALRTGVSAALVAGGLLSGCAPVTPVPTTVAMPGMPNPEAALQQSINHVDAEMAELGRLTPTATQADQPLLPEDLRRTVTFAWAGPLDDGVAKLAASIGYTFYTTGPASQRPLDVAIQISSVPVYQVFQALGEEAGAQATVQLDPQHHQVQVIHHA